MRFLLFAAGAFIVVAIAVDVIWTAIGTHGGGPLSKHFTRFLWSSAVALHKRGLSDRALSFAGALILLLTIAAWLSATCLGWALIFGSDPDAVLDSDSGQPAGIAARIYFSAYVMSTLGNGDYVPNGAGWQLAVAVATMTGMALLTLSVTFIFAVVSAVVEKRALASYISGMGGAPAEILRRAWTGDGFQGLDQYLLHVAGKLHLFAEQHLAYPVLHHFHAEQRRTSVELRLCALYETHLLLTAGVVPQLRPPAMISAPLHDAFDTFAEVLHHEYVGDRGEPPPPTLDPLRALSIPCVSDEEFLRGVDASRETRKRLYASVVDNGWTWEDAFTTGNR